jgi:PLP dependent protein
MHNAVRNNLTRVLSRMQAVAMHCGRAPGDIRLVAVGKTFSAPRIAEAIAAGAGIIGESYIQEARDKLDALLHEPVQWHFIGHLQTNKAKYAVRMFDLIHTVDSMKLGLELDRQARKSGKVQQILIQVNLAEETQKSGVSRRQAIALTHDLGALESIKVRGLMTIPPYFDDPERARPFFSDLRSLRDELHSLQIPNIDMRELSMGMTGDFEAAIEEGATLVRIGSAIFGERS